MTSKVLYCTLLCIEYVKAEISQICSELHAYTQYFISRYENNTNLSDISNDAFDEDDLESESDIDTSSDASDDDNEVESETMSSQKPWSASYDRDIYTSGIAVQIIPGANITVLQWLALNLKTFSSHPSISKSAFSHYLKLQAYLYQNKDVTLPTSYQ